MKTITQICKECKQNFEAQLREVNRGNAKYCSKKCSKIGISKTHLERNAKINLPNVECSYCHKIFYKSNSKKKSPKSNLHFCCREHKDLAQRIEFGLKDIHPPHYSGGSSSYRDIALRNFPNKCANCEYDKIPEILEVHHKDRNRENNNLENLIILCSRCHDEQHFLTNSGRWG
jgi:5-methylcytosine-specific restriction endonuclease McrA